jgi:hypothetical protein
MVPPSGACQEGNCVWQSPRTTRLRGKVCSAHRESTDVRASHLSQLGLYLSTPAADTPGHLRYR